jgi:cytochrome P450
MTTTSMPKDRPATPLADLDLYHLDWDAPEVPANPYPFFEEARKKHPWLLKTSTGYVVFGYRAIRDLMFQDDKMRTSFDEIVTIMGAENTPWGRFTEEQMLNMSAENHRAIRDTFAARFTPRYANSVRPIMQENMLALLREWLPKRRIDFAEFASFYPVSVMTRMIGAPLDVIPGIRDSLEALGLAFSLDPKRLPSLQKAIEHIDGFCRDLVEERRRSPRREGHAEDLLDILIEASAEGGIDDRKLIDMLIFLFVAGYDTSKNVLGWMMREMTAHPDIYRRCAEDADYCRQVVEEFLRYWNPSHSFRATDQEITYDGVIFPKDTMLFFSLSMSGRDPSIFDRPDEFDPDRAVDPKNRQIAFGLGKHMCLGQYIARAQLQEGIHLVAQHMLNPRIVGELEYKPFPVNWGLSFLPIEFTPAEL